MQGGTWHTSRAHVAQHQHMPYVSPCQYLTTQSSIKKTKMSNLPPYSRAEREQTIQARASKQTDSKIEGYFLGISHNIPEAKEKSETQHPPHPMKIREVSIKKTQSIIILLELSAGKAELHNKRMK